MASISATLYQLIIIIIIVEMSFNEATNTYRDLV